MSRDANNTLSRAGGIAIGAGLIGAAVVGGALASGMRRGRSPDDAPGRTARRGFGEYDVSGRTVTIRKPRAEVFRAWREFEKLPQFMENVVSVRPGDGEGRWRWTIRAPRGVVELETEVVREQENELIAWRSTDKSEIDTEGRVEFRDAPGDRGTQVTAIIAYKPPAGEAGRAIAKLFQREPQIQARHDLKRLKMLLETGEIATSARTADATRKAKMEEA
ncbi:cyclase [Altererythrobacter sp. B11]|uniref:SRPBCC family protein n=1 Tax=Altererythrobacter sp. B11 TaxID=2060312 RepID=UPI000DC70FED|nr:SRPBCC family protein [Altererythrobacter sp. B11]BBC72819.1 cyclase [Altererythrobacter sp. B11]